MTEVHDLGVIELAAALRAKQVSPVEVVNAYLVDLKTPAHGHTCPAR